MTDNFEDQDCINCFIRFRVPSGFTARRREDKNTFYCPNGHSMSYSESQTDKLRRELDRAKQNAAYLEDVAKRERQRRELAERQAAAARGQVTKLKNRASHGVCPCCNRTFLQLQRHMATKHPQFLAENVVPIKGSAA